MFRKFTSRTYYVLLLFLSLSISGCRSDEPISHSDDRFADTNEMIVYETDSTEWHVCLLAKGLLYSEAVQVEMPDPWQLPTQSDAQVLKTLEYPSDERFVTSDGYTFGMPSASVSKAGSKTRYSVLGLWKRPTTINVPF